MQNVLVTGGAGYIGSHAVLGLIDSGYTPIVLDNLSTGRRGLIPEGVEFIQEDVANISQLKRVLADCFAVMHFAGSVIVEESVKNPLKYYQNNTENSRRLIEACVECGVKNFVFSSTAAVYGEPAIQTVSETSTTIPINPYGYSKLMTEQILIDCAKAYGLNYAILRYFNVAGADVLGRSGQSTPNATHLIKVAVETALGKRNSIAIFGDDYDTPDGTCIRDYIHVSDLIDAHILALDYISHGDNLLLNCGYGHGASVREVLNMVEKVAGCRLDISIAPRRAGDSPCLIADNTAIKEKLNWQPQYDDLEIIIKTALDWKSVR